jgi:hypothetical protein
MIIRTVLRLIVDLTSDDPSPQTTTSEDQLPQTTTSEDQLPQTTTSDDPSPQTTTSDDPSPQTTTSEDPLLRIYNVTIGPVHNSDWLTVMLQLNGNMIRAKIDVTCMHNTNVSSEKTRNPRKDWGYVTTTVTGTEAQLLAYRRFIDEIEYFKKYNKVWESSLE